MLAEAKFFQSNNQEVGSKISVQLLLVQLNACSKAQDLERGKQIHAKAVECGYDSSRYVATQIVTMYTKCGSMVDAYQVFDGIKLPDVVLWTTLILGYADNGQGQSALDLFIRMRIGGTAPDSVTFVAALKACTSLAEKGARVEYRAKALHNLATESGYVNVYVQNTLLDLHAKCGNMLDAREIFESIKHPNSVSWNALILGYAENGKGYTALDLFTGMRFYALPNLLTFLAALKALNSLVVRETSRWGECRVRGKAIHNLADANGWKDVRMQSTLVDMYAKCGSMLNAREMFDSMKFPNVVSWNVLIFGYAENGEGHLALDLFASMRAEGHAPTCVTFLAVLKACGLVGALELGRKIHSEIVKGNESVDVALVNCLVDFYAKCGSLKEAQSVFDLHAEERNIITWNALLAGFSNFGDNEAAFALLERMEAAGVQPNAITFLCILMCCSHAGLVEKGKECFDSMSTKYGVVPTLEHYSSMIDIFGRANKLHDAMDLLESMPCNPNDVTWKTILGASRKWKNVDIGWLAFQSLINLKDDEA